MQYLEPNAQVGEKWQYNNFMFLAQGVIIEKLIAPELGNQYHGSIFSSRWA